MENEKVATLKVEHIAETIDSMVPADTQEEWDNSGMQVGFEAAPVTKLLTCLELDRQVLEEAKELGAEMIVTHHPLLFSGIKSLRDSNAKGSLVMELVRCGISVYSCHTPFDKAKGGNNDIIMEKLGLVSVKALNGDALGRMGRLKDPMSFSKVIELTAMQLELSIRQISAVGVLDQEISTVGVCTGAGADMMRLAAAAGCDLFITGDVKYHEAQEARELGICVIDAGHYGTEKFFGAAMREMLQRKLGNQAEVIASKVDLDPFLVL